MPVEYLSNFWSRHALALFDNPDLSHLWPGFEQLQVPVNSSAYVQVNPQLCQKELNRIAAVFSQNVSGGVGNSIAGICMTVFHPPVLSVACLCHLMIDLVGESDPLNLTFSNTTATSLIVHWQLDDRKSNVSVSYRYQVLSYLVYYERYVDTHSVADCLYVCMLWFTVSAYQSCLIFMILKVGKLMVYWKKLLPIFLICKPTPCEGMLVVVTGFKLDRWHLKQVGALETSLLVTELHPAEEYVFHVVAYAISSAQEGMKSNIARERTLDAGRLLLSIVMYVKMGLGCIFSSI